MKRLTRPVDVTWEGHPRAPYLFDFEVLERLRIAIEKALEERRRARRLEEAQ